MFNFVGAIATLFIFSYSSANGQIKPSDYKLRAVSSSAQLPTGDGCHRLIYDGADSIHIIGGCNNPDKFLTYSIAADTIISAGKLPTYFYYGSINTDPAGNHFLFGSGQGNGVLKFDPKTNRTTTAATLPWSIYGYPTLKQSANKILSVGSQGDISRILSFDMATSTVTPSPLKLSPSSLDLYNAVGIVHDGRAFVFKPISDSVLELNMETMTLSNIGTSDFPSVSYNPSAVSDGSSVFIVAGFWPQQAPFPSHEGILHFDPRNNLTTFVPVENWPIKDGGGPYYYMPPQCVLVPKSQDESRLYCFGGITYSGGYTYLADIFYVDGFGGTGTEPVFSCEGLSNGFYPHPSDCSSYFGCRNEVATQFTCPPPLLFDKIGQNCDYPGNVQCDII